MPPPDFVGSLISAVDQSNEFSRARVLNDAERVGAMADEAGQTALYGVVQRREILDALENGYDSALWMFFNEPDAFRHAEEVRYTDERRRGRMWDGFIGQPGLTLQRDPEVLNRFKAAMCARFDAKNVHVDIFDRQRPSFDGDDCRARPGNGLSGWSSGRLPRVRERHVGPAAARPVYEAALTYERPPASSRWSPTIERTARTLSGCLPENCWEANSNRSGFLGGGTTLEFCCGPMISRVIRKTESRVCA